ncbi:cysteine desulfurase [Actinosynnema sp. NPDC047251]|uniref:cysteine desulfurase n=1 Tax=Saccharothrix espanaensis (strain ATCC 51144 / DSM 44229 / JCM 9112 / NBRC 15066 / NRRL 15764) TaxID=1179773 RepID=K0K7A2_SACES|nr:cysteine desulfurase [Saccharothrix espanaensis]CCH32774.1 Cysteine desulfurase [Saccharothrix espanaensis DSM 44229]
MSAEHNTPAGLPRDVRADFPILGTDLDGRTPVYLDNAATTHVPQQVLTAMYGYYTNDHSNVGRGVHALGMRATGRFMRSRERVRDFLNAADASEVVFTKSATESLNLVAHGFGPQVVSSGDEVLISGLEHHSNLLPWRELCARTGATLQVADVDEHGEPSLDAFRAKITDRTRVIAVAHVSNVQGTVNPVREIAAEAHARGIVVVVDGAQAVAHRKVDVRDLDADFYCFSGHKMYGPHGVGVLYGKAEHFARLEPLLLGGGMTPIATYADGPLGARPPLRFEAGSPNIAGMVGIAAAMDYLDELGRDAVGEHDAALAARAAEGLRALDGVTVYGAQAPLGGIVSFNVDGVHPNDVGSHLDSFGIATRTGVHCATPLLDSLGLVGSVRASFGVYNTAAEVDLLVESVGTAEKGFWSTEHPNERFLPG